MKTPKRVVWSEGMFMAPQHLQQQDAYMEELVQTRLLALNPFVWGVVDVVFDTAALNAGEVRLNEATVVFPDGLPVALDATQASLLPAARSMDGHFAPTQPRIEIFLGVPRQRDGVANFGDGGAEDESRYTRSSTTVVDASAAASHVEVEFGHAHLKLLFGDEPRGEFEAIKVAEVARDSAGVPVLVDDYVPPLLRLSGSAWLQHQFAELLSLMVARQRALARSTRQREGAAVEFSASDVTRYLMLNAINSYVPVVRHMAERGTSHPEAAFLELSKLAGQLSTFTVEAETGNLPQFNFTDLRATFGGLLGRIRELLGVTMVENFIRVPLRLGPDGAHHGQLSDERLMDCTQWFLAVRTEIDERQVATNLPKLSKVASDQDINGFVQAALPGVPLRVSYRPPSAIPVRQGIVYFQLDTADPNWRNVLFGRTLAVYLPPPFDGDKVHLEVYAVPD